MKRLLIVSPHFPPTNAPDMQRVRMSLPYYRAAGWEPTVLTIDAGSAAAPVEPELLATVPNNVRIIAVSAYSRRWTRYLGVGTLGLRSWLPLRSAGARLLRDERFDLVFFSNTQFITFTLGESWLRTFGVPYVLDVQDPWLTDHYERKGVPPPGGWKYRFARWQAQKLEGPAFARASGIMSVSPNYITTLKQRYPAIADVPAEVIRFGASAADKEAAVRGPASEHSFRRSRDEIHFVYTGAAGPIMPDAATLLFAAVRGYRDRSPDKAGRLRFHFFGTSYVAPGEGRPVLLPLAEDHGVGDLVNEVPHRLGHLECIRLQTEADVLLLPGSSDLDYSPSKTFPYYLTGKPVLGLVFRGSVLENLLDTLGGAAVIRFAEHESRSSIYRELHAFFDAALAGFPAGTLPARKTAEFDRHYLAEELTRQQGALFDRALAYHAERTRPANERIKTNDAAAN